VRVSARVAGPTLEIIVSDDGQGFMRHDARTPAKGDGLDNMRRRADAIGAVLAVEGGVERGTTVRLAVKFHGLAAL
jgi:signal transduction histidine kinase